MGDWAGQSYDAVEGSRSSHSNPPNGEHHKDFFSRVQKGITNILDTYNSPVLIVSHGGVFRALGGIYGLTLSYTTKNCHLYEFQPNPDKTPFPWDVYSYAYDEDMQNITRLKETLYDGDF